MLIEGMHYKLLRFLAFKSKLKLGYGSLEAVFEKAMIL